MNKFVLGFAFDTKFDVCLIHKNKPEWQAGKLNGIGGHIEKHEAPVTAMMREFSEEAGIVIPIWRHFANMFSTGWHVQCFFSLEAPLKDAKSMTDENVIIVPSMNLPDTVLWNLRWLIPRALDVEIHAITEFDYGAGNTKW